MKKLTRSQAELVELMKAGWTPVIYRDDPRTRYYSPTRHPGLPRESKRGKSSVVLALLARDIIEVQHNEPDRNCSTNGKRIGGATRYRLKPS